MISKKKKTKCELIQMIRRYDNETKTSVLWAKHRKELIRILIEHREKEKSNEQNN